MTLEPGNGQTVLVGDIRDQSHLYGVLDRVRNLGLELVSVEAVPMAWQRHDKETAKWQSNST
jgi:hypothetical protein